MLKRHVDLIVENPDFIEGKQDILVLH